MTIRREDLVAAASLGLLKYRQIDPLLVFLLQRDVRARRLALAAQARSAQRHWLYAPLLYVVIALAVVTAGLFATLFAAQASRAFGAGGEGLYALAGAYGLAALVLIGWWRWRRRSALHGNRTWLLLTVAVASAPLAVLALQQITV